MSYIHNKVRVSQCAQSAFLTVADFFCSFQNLMRGLLC